MAYKLPAIAPKDPTAAWRLAKALRLHERRRKLFRDAAVALDNDQMERVERVVGHIRELDGEIKGLEETP
jgi:hypothetical protein